MNGVYTLYSIYVRVRTVPENACCLYRQRDRPFFLFWPVNSLIFFSSKETHLHFTGSRQSTKMLLALAHQLQAEYYKLLHQKKYSAFAYAEIQPIEYKSRSIQ
jgi:hypothetical protein